MEKQKEALTDLITTAIARCCVLRESGEKVDEAAVIADFLAEHGVMVPPVKVGQTVYYPIRHTNKVEQLFVREIVYTGREIQFYASYLAFTVDRIGITIFLNREEAEKALAERSENGKS